MNFTDTVLRNEEKVIFNLRALYQKYGYTQYKMSKFEEYDLYADHKDFLVSDHVITFNDMNGKLMALKPDVTLSIVRNTKDDLPGVEKVYYNENVYRVSKGTQAFREMMQVGLECIGDVGEYDIAEVVTLAAESLKEISDECSLQVSHLDLLSDMVERLKVPDGYRTDILKYISDKNLHDYSALCSKVNAEPEAAAALMKLMQSSGKPEEVLPLLNELGCEETAIRELQMLSEALNEAGFGDLLRFDFSVIHDMNYYNGIVFQGFVSGVPTGVLSGGQYDKLMQKMGRKAKTIGFAVYTDALDCLYRGKTRYDVDTVLLYDDSVSKELLYRTVRSMTARGERVSAQKAVPEKIRYKTLAQLTESGVKPLG